MHMEVVTKFLNGVVGGSMVSGFLLFVFRGQNKKMEVQSNEISKKVGIDKCKIISKSFEKTTDEIKVDIKEIKKSLSEQLVIITQSSTTLDNIKHSMNQRRDID